MKAQFPISIWGIDYLVDSDFFSNFKIIKTELVGENYFFTVEDGSQISINKKQYLNLLIHQILE